MQGSAITRNYSWLAREWLVTECNLSMLRVCMPTYRTVWYNAYACKQMQVHTMLFKTRYADAKDRYAKKIYGMAWLRTFPCKQIVWFLSALLCSSGCVLSCLPWWFARHHHQDLPLWKIAVAQLVVMARTWGLCQDGTWYLLLSHLHSDDYEIDHVPRNTHRLLPRMWVCLHITRDAWRRWILRGDGRAGDHGVAGIFLGPLVASFIFWPSSKDSRSLDSRPFRRIRARYLFPIRNQWDDVRCCQKKRTVPWYFFSLFVMSICVMNLKINIFSLVGWFGR